MSYGYAAALQTAVFRRLSDDAALATLIGGAIHDGPVEVAPGAVPGDYVTLGEERVRPFGTKTSDGAVHDFEVTVHSDRDGFETVKRIAAVICDALVDAPLALQRGTLVGLRFLGASAQRGPAPIRRRIALRFRATIDGN